MAQGTPVQATVDFNPASDFKTLPLDVVIAQPLVAAVNAQKLAADATVAFVKSMMNGDGTAASPYTPTTVDFSTTIQGGDAASPQKVVISAPLLSIVPIPHLRIDSLSVSFKYEVSQSVTASQSKTYGVNADFKAGSKLLPIFSGEISGNLTSSAKQDSTTNRSGSIDIEMHASEGPIPEGLAKILNLLALAIPTKSTPAT